MMGLRYLSHTFQNAEITDDIYQLLSSSSVIQYLLKLASDHYIFPVIQKRRRWLEKMIAVLLFSYHDTKHITNGLNFKILLLDGFFLMKLC
jgi:hypothetical protein